MRLLCWWAVAATAAACGDDAAVRCTRAPYATSVEAIADGCDTCPESWWERDGRPPVAGSVARAAVTLPEALDDGLATWRGSDLDGRIVLGRPRESFVLEVPGLEASDFAWLAEGTSVEVRRGERPGAVTIRLEDGTFVFQSHDARHPDDLVGDPEQRALSSAEGLRMEAQSEATCVAVGESFAVRLTGPLLSGQGMRAPRRAEVGETGRVTVGGREHAFRGTYHRFAYDIYDAGLLSLPGSGHGAGWLAATSE